MVLVDHDEPPRTWAYDDLARAVIDSTINSNDVAEGLDTPAGHSSTVASGHPRRPLFDHPAAVGGGTEDERAA